MRRTCSPALKSPSRLEPRPPMNAESIRVRRTGPILYPDQSRVLLRPFVPGDANRIGRIISRILAMPEREAGTLLGEITAEFSKRHQHIADLFRARFEQLGPYMPTK